MEQAIKKAIEGGYGNSQSQKLQYYDEEKNGAWFTWFDGEDVTEETLVPFSFLLLDPLFWQALGKADGWKDVYIGQPKYVKGALYGQSVTGNEVWQEWLYHWHRFIDHLAQGGDVDEFFNNLLKKQ